MLIILFLLVLNFVNEKQDITELLINFLNLENKLIDRDRIKVTLQKSALL